MPPRIAPGQVSFFVRCRGHRRGGTLWWMRSMSEGRIRGKALAASTPAHDLPLRVRVVGPFRSYPDSARVAPERSQLGCPTTEGKVRLCGGI
jgi:hypothetical protein